MLWLRLLISVSDTIVCGIALGVVVLGVVSLICLMLVRSPISRSPLTKVRPPSS